MNPGPPFMAVPLMALLALPAQAGDPKPRAEDFLKQGIAASQAGDGARALDSLSQALARFRQRGDRRGEAVTLGYLGTALDALGEKEKALSAFEQAVPLLRAAGDKAGEAALLNRLARRCLGLGERAQARDHLQRVLALERDLGDRDGEVAALNELGRLSSDLGEDAKALAYYQQALRRGTGSPAPPVPRWTDKASLSFVEVGGNAVSQSFGLANELVHAWSEATSLAFNVRAVRVATRTTAYAATGSSPTSFSVAATETEQVTTADYLAKARFAQDLAGRRFWFAEAGWERDIPSGIEARTAGSAGLGIWWSRTGTRKLRTDVGAGYTRAQPVTQAPGFQVGYATWSAAASYEQKFGGATTFTSSLNGTAAFKDIDNHLVVWLNDCSVELSRRLALKVGYVLTYNNRPAAKAVPIIQAGSTPPVRLGQTFVTLRPLDTQFTTSLVISF